MPFSFWHYKNYQFGVIYFGNFELKKFKICKNWKIRFVDRRRHFPFQGTEPANPEDQREKCVASPRSRARIWRLRRTKLPQKSSKSISNSFLSGHPRYDSLPTSRSRSSQLGRQKVGSSADQTPRPTGSPRWDFILVFLMGQQEITSFCVLQPAITTFLLS